jgi:hypothetical protein
MVVDPSGGKLTTNRLLVHGEKQEENSSKVMTEAINFITQTDIRKRKSSDALRKFVCVFFFLRKLSKVN